MTTTGALWPATYTYPSTDREQDQFEKEVLQTVGKEHYEQNRESIYQVRREHVEVFAEILATGYRVEEGLRVLNEMANRVPYRSLRKTMDWVRINHPVVSRIATRLKLQPKPED